MVDYSKWDNLDLGNDSDEEPAAPERLKGQPRVTRLEPGTTVTMGPQGITAVRPPPADGAALAVADGPAPAPAPAPAASVAVAAAEKKKAKVLDYSKWDNLAVSDSEEEESEEDEGLEQWAETQEAAATAAGKRWPGMDQHPPPAAAADADPQSTAAAAPAAAPAATAEAAAAAAAAAPAAAAEAAAAADARSSKLTAATPPASSKNGGRTQCYLWSQEKEDVSVAVLAPPGTAAKAVVVQLSDEKIKVGLRRTKANGGSTWLISGQLFHPAEAPEDPTELDWEIRDLLPEEDAALLLGAILYCFCTVFVLFLYCFCTVVYVLLC